MQEKLLLFATLEEAKESLSFLKATQVEASLWKYAGGWVSLTGWGHANASSACLKHRERGESVWNLGVAGGLHEELPLGSVHRIMCVGRQAHPPLPLPSVGKRLITWGSPLHDSLIRKQLAKEWDLVDMEGYGIVSAMQRIGKPCVLIKLLSDFARIETKELIQKNMPLYSKRLAEVLEETHQ